MKLNNIKISINIINWNKITQNKTRRWSAIRKFGLSSAADFRECDLTNCYSCLNMLGILIPVDSFFSLC